MDKVKTICNWTRIGGQDWPEVIQTQLVDDEIIKPELSELLNNENAILLRRKMKVDNEAERENCELELSLFPRFKISALTVICTVPKLEVFLGTQSEYYETEHGCLLDDFGDEDTRNDAVNFHSYRYDIEIEKSGVTELTFKLLTADDEICIFAILLQIAPNPNGVTTLLPNPINFENVQKMLEGSSQKLAPSAEKCKQFLQMFNKARDSQRPIGLPLAATTSADALKAIEKSTNETTLNMLKDHFDTRMKELERKIEARLEALEVQQLAKLEEILKSVQALK